MASNPTPETRFEAWGESVYQVDAFGDPRVAPRPEGFTIVFAISDLKRQWLGWYVFQSGNSIDNILLQAAHHLLGEKSVHSSHFSTDKAITVEELVGPILHSRGAKLPSALTAMSSATLVDRGDVLNAEVEIKGINRSKNNLLSHIRLYLKRKGSRSLPAKFSMGWTSFLFSEPFAYPSAHLNVGARLRGIERKYFALN
jgi:hypothetical protein